MQSLKSMNSDSNENGDGNMAWWNLFDKLDDALKTIVDATFGWSNTLQEKHLDNIRTRNKIEIERTQAELENERKRLDAEIQENERVYQEQIRQAQSDDTKKMMRLEHQLQKKEIQFKVDMVGKITQIVSGLQNTHSRQVMALLTEYKQQQISIINELKNSNAIFIEQIASEAKPYRDSFPEIFSVKMEQLDVELSSHRKLLDDIITGMNTDLNKIQNWLLDASRFNAEEFILKISGSKVEAKNFQNFLSDRKINFEQLTPDNEE